MGDDSEGKRCADCGEVKPLSSFWNLKKSAADCAEALPVERFSRSRSAPDVTEVDVALMAYLQEGRCAICRKPAPEHVDHDHATGQPRGILCFNCNQGLGNFRDDPVLLARAVDYLMRGTPCAPDLRALVPTPFRRPSSV